MYPSCFFFQGWLQRVESSTHPATAAVLVQAHEYIRALDSDSRTFFANLATLENAFTLSKL